MQSHQRLWCALGALTAAGLAAPSAGAITIDPVSNNSFTGAAEIPIVGEIGALAFPITLDTTGSDVDFFKLNLRRDQVIVISTGTNFGPFVDSPDTTLALLDSEGQLVAGVNDNSGSNNQADALGSLVQATITETGEYFLVVSGSGDLDFDGLIDPAPGDLTNQAAAGHGETGLYLLSVSFLTIPSPGAAALALMAGALAATSRARSRR
ncbi:MAG: PPC domain-containing protein [Planctomycetota bacterium]